MRRPDLCVLLVDDDAAARRAIAGLLEGSGFEVLQAESGTAALATLDAREAARGHVAVDLLATDLEMPGIDGLALARLVRVCWPTLPIVIMSGREPPPAPVLDRLHVSFLAKPFVAEEFERARQRAIGARSVGRLPGRLLAIAR